MDASALQRDLLAVLKKLPPQFVQGMAQAVFPHVPALKPLLPEIFATFKPHALAGVSEMGMETLDMNELSNACIGAFGDYAAHCASRQPPANDNGNGG